MFESGMWSPFPDPALVIIESAKKIELDSTAG
jgi:hypothetical protein